MAAKELVEYVARSLVDDPEAVTVTQVEDEEGTVIELHVAEALLDCAVGEADVEATAVDLVTPREIE